jgi:hypothetical protein
MTALSQLHHQLSPTLVREAIRVHLLLIRRTTLPGSDKRFDQLSVLLGDGIIGSVWAYAYQNTEAIIATNEVLPDICRMMGIGLARYLKVREIL